MVITDPEAPRDHAQEHLLIFSQVDNEAHGSSVLDNIGAKK